MGVACLGAFLFIVAAGSVFIFVRIRKQNASEVPAPEPPAMTIDAPAASNPSERAPDIQSDQAPRATPPKTVLPDETAPLPLQSDAPAPYRKAFTPIDEVDEDPTERRDTKPLAAGIQARPEDETERVSFPSPKAAPTFISLSELEDLDESEAETATVIIDRSKPPTEDES